MHRIQSVVLGLVMAGVPGFASAVTVLTAANSGTGANGADSNGFQVGGASYYGIGGLNGDRADTGTEDYVVAGPTLTGGNGGLLTGNSFQRQYLGGSGGSGLFAGVGTAPHSIVVNSGTFTGGRGGGFAGTGQYATGGDGGAGLFVYGTTTTINAGTFRGGNGGTPNGTLADNNIQGNGSGGAALFVTDSNVVIYGGNFVGGTPGSNASAYAGAGGPALFTQGFVSTPTRTDIYGGTFSAGVGGTGLGYDPGTAYDVVLGNNTIVFHGTDFKINGVAMPYGTYQGLGVGTLSGLLSLNTTTTTLRFNDRSGNFGGVPAGAIVLAPIPEPTTLAVLGTAGVLLGLRRRK